jgi:poly-gamma-glutamate capsule biosynthesis protein CapA/YwtB (metallophosphatase superfamily)
MKPDRMKPDRTRRTRLAGLARMVAAGLLATGAAWASGAGVAGQQSLQQQSAVPVPPRDPAQELALKIAAPFTLASVGDIIEMQPPIAQLAEPGFQSLVKIIRDADIGFANMESSIADVPRFAGPIGGLLAPKELAADVRAMGFRIVNRANNHTLDADTVGMLSTDALLDEAGVAHAGSGRNLEDAREAHFYTTPRGRVGLVGMFPISDPSFTRTAATSRSGNMGGRPGLNPLRLTTYNVVTPDQFQALRKIRDSVNARRSEVPNPVVLPEHDASDRLELFGSFYKVGPRPGDLSYEMNPADRTEILRSIRNGKYYADFMIATIHAHQNRFAFQHYSFDNGVPDYLIELAHACIDNGADAFVGHGVHTLRPVEIYKGKPIFYGLSNFIFQLNSPVGGENAEPVGDRTRAERLQAQWDWLQQPDNLEVLLTTSRYDGGRLVEVRLYPVDIGQTRRPISRMGIPMAASPEMARRVLEKMVALSKPFGTTIAIEGGVGVIRVVPGASSTAGVR